MAWCWNLPPFWSMKSGQTLKVMVVTRTCLSPLAPMAAFSAARVGFCQRLLAVSSSGVCFKAVQRPLSRSVPCSFMPVSIISVLIGSRGIFRQFVSMRNQEILHTEHIVLVSLTAVPSESSFQQDPSLEKKIKEKTALNKERHPWSTGSAAKDKGLIGQCSFQILLWDLQKTLSRGKPTIRLKPLSKTQLHSCHGEMCSELCSKSPWEEGMAYKTMCHSLQLCIFQLRKNVHMNKDSICMRTKIHDVTTWETQVMPCNTPVKQPFLKMIFFLAYIDLLESSSPHPEQHKA